jgi:hypothetical protein
VTPKASRKDDETEINTDLRGHVFVASAGGFADRSASSWIKRGLVKLWLVLNLALMIQGAITFVACSVGYNQLSALLWIVKGLVPTS